LRRDRIDEIGDRLGLDQIDPAVGIRAERELARCRKPGAMGHGQFNDPRQQHRAAVSTHLHHVVAGIGMRRGKPGEHDLVHGPGR
jgi:hypothetical protein